MMTVPFEQLPHTADIKIRAYGSTKQELFGNALKGMFESVHPRIADAKPETTRLLVSEGKTLEELFINFLSDCLYLSDTNNEVYRSIEFLEFDDTHLHATLVGTPILGFETTEIKAVTHHEFSLVEKNNQYIATFVLDI